MHDLSMFGPIYEILDRAAAGRSVAVIHLQVGQLRQIVPDTLKYCWTLVCDQTALAGSEVDHEHGDLSGYRTGPDRVRVSGRRSPY